MRFKIHYPFLGKNGDDEDRVFSFTRQEEGLGYVSARLTNAVKEEKVLLEEDGNFRSNGINPIFTDTLGSLSE